MAGHDRARKLRKGTRSCVECRKRKLRCAWTSAAAQKCRRCEERVLECSPQTVSSPSTSQPPRTVQDRVSRLEDELRRLTKAVRSLDPAGAGDWVRQHLCGR